MDDFDPGAIAAAYDHLSKQGPGQDFGNHLGLKNRASSGRSRSGKTYTSKRNDRRYTLLQRTGQAPEIAYHN